MRKTSLGIASAILAISVFFPSCSSSSGSEIVGIWKRLTPTQELISGDYNDLLALEKVEFLKDGSFVILSFNNITGKYSFPVSGRVKMEYPNGAAMYKYELTNNTLTLQQGEKRVRYERIQ